MRVPLLLSLLASSVGFAQTEDGGLPPSEVDAGTPPLKVTGKLGKGIEFRTEDDDFRLQLRGRIQLRATQFSEKDGRSPDVTELQARRVRLLFQGHVWGGGLEYYLQLGFSNLDMESDLRSPLRDAYVTFTGVRDLQLRFGQMKIPFGRQRVVSSSALQMPERSIVVGELNLDRDVGVQLFSNDLFGVGKRLSYRVGVFSGDGRNRLATEPGVLFVGRLSFRPFGGFDDYVEGDHERRATPKLALSVGAARNRNTNRPRSTFGTPYEFARFDYTHLETDLMFKWRGFSLMSELIFRDANDRFEERVDDDGEAELEYARRAWGYYAQAGYLVNEHLEFTARYGQLRGLVSSAPDLQKPQREAGAGVNWYFQKHDLKLQSDYFYLYGDPGTAGRHQIRVQFQLYF